MSEIKLLPCPFCGGEAKIRSRKSIYNSERTLWSIWCVGCGVGRGDIFAEFYDKENAIDWWNTRKPMQEIKNKLEEQLIEVEKVINGCAFKGLPYYDSAKDFSNGINISMAIVKEVGGMNG